MNKLYFLYLLLISHPALSQVATAQKEVSFFYDIVGKKGLLFAIAVMFFTYSYKNSVKLFAWIEDQTYGTRDFILQQFELLFIKVKPNHVTYGLLFITFGFSFIVMLIFFAMGKFTAGGIFAAILTVIGWKIPRPFMNMLVARRIKKYESQMVDALGLLSNGMRAGLTLQQSIGMVVQELPAPVNQEFDRILQETKFGIPLEDAFDNLVKRVPTEDNDMFVSSVNILKEGGGNLAEIFDTIAEVIRERIRLKQKIDTFVAQGKMQGGMIAAMPTLMALYFGSTDPKFFDLLLGTPMGILVLVIAYTLNIAGAFFMWKVIQIKV